MTRASSERFEFAPTPQRNNALELKEDLSEFTRILRLLDFFHETDYDADDSLVKNKSTFIPPKQRNPAPERYITNLDNTPLERNGKQCRENISKCQRDAIRSLALDKDLVIKDADKGGMVVIMDKKHYLSMSLDILNDQNYYERLESNPEKSNKLTYTRLLICKESNVHGMEIENVKDLKLRPIIAGPACHTHILSNMLDILLRPFTNHV